MKDKVVPQPGGSPAPADAINTPPGTAALDARLAAFRADLADERLAGIVAAPRYTAGREARIIVGRAAVRRAPDDDAMVDTYYHYGEAVRIFAQDGSYAWCQSCSDGYVGYVDNACLGGAAAPTHYIVPLGAYAYERPDLRSRAIDFLPRHSALTVAETGLATRGTEYARLDTGCYLPLACLSPQPARSPDIVEAARRYLGCPYLWAGKSCLGVDCSGLVQNAFRDIGILVLRDTDMQRDTIGAALIARDERDLRRGDLLYLPGHVLIYAGTGEVIHADGASVMVRREGLADLLRTRALNLADLMVRRHPRAGG